jgi:antitoxin component of MazEF toxin-antitoxin module
MFTTLTPVGNDLALVIDPDLLEILNIDETTKLAVRTNGIVIFVRPIRSARDEAVMRAAERVMKIHDENLRKLAD